MYKRRFNFRPRRRYRFINQFAKEHPYNEYIKFPSVRVIDNDGKNLGVMQTQDAIKYAKQKGLDLVVIAPAANPPVCKVIDLAQYKYQLQKKEKEKRKSQRKTKIKEVKFSPKIAQGDLDRKIGKINELTQEGYTVKVTIMRRRWMQKPMIEDFKQKLLTLLEECCNILSSQEKGRDIHILVKAKNAKTQDSKNSKKKGENNGKVKGQKMEVTQEPSDDKKKKRST